MRAPSGSKCLSLRRTRGAALVEAVVAMPFFIVILGGTIFAGNLYQTKLRTMRRARQSAWTEAISNCGRGGDPMTTHLSRDEGLPAPSVRGGEAYSAVDAKGAETVTRVAPHADTLEMKLDVAEAKLSAIAAADRVIGRFSSRMSSHTEVTCNEAPHDGDMGVFNRSLWSVIAK